MAIVSNSAQMAPLDDSPYVKALLDHDEAEARRVIDEMDSPIVAYMGSKHALGRAVRRRVRSWGDARVRLNGVAPGPRPDAAGDRRHRPPRVLGRSG